jgi:tRNA (guanine-N7-)-methyltransferase
MQRVTLAAGSNEVDLGSVEVPLALDGLVAGSEPWEIELGFGKGRYLLGRAESEPHRRFLGIEVASDYFRMVRRRMVRRSLSNLVLLRGEALFLLASVLPVEIADSVHIYFPDPWPKARHLKRRLLDVETVDLVLRLLVPGGRIFFATDFLEYGEQVREALTSHPQLRVDEHRSVWDGGARTNYETKYEVEGRRILRLIVTRLPSPGSSGDLVHPAAATAILAASR